MSGFQFDTVQAVEEDVPDLILDNLLYFFPGPYVMLSAFVDESGTHDPKVTCVAGLLYTRHKMRQLNRAWKRSLDNLRLRYFHAVESSHLRGEFSGIKREEEDRLYRRLIKQAARYACGGAVAYVTGENKFDEYAERNSWRYSQYTTCAYACIQLLLRAGGDEKIDFTIESGHKDMGELDTLLRRLTDAGMDGTFGFRDKKSLRLLQTADLWAYEAWRRIRDQFEPNPRRLRASLRAIVEGIPNIHVIPVNKESLPTLFRQVQRQLSEENS